MDKKYIDVLWIKAHPRYAYSAGQKGIVIAEAAPELIRDGFVIPLNEKEQFSKSSPEKKKGRPKAK